MVKISEIMSKKVVAVPKEKGLKEVVKAMANSKISSIMITDGGRVVGIVTERDLIKHIANNSSILNKRSIDDVMTKDPITVNSHTDLSEASQMMNNHGIRHLPIVDNERLVGLVTQTDIVKETHNIHRKNQTFMTYQNIQTIIIVMLFLFLFAYLAYRRFYL